MRTFFPRKTGGNLYRWSPIPPKPGSVIKSRQVTRTCIKDGCFLAVIGGVSTLIDWDSTYAYEQNGECYRIAYVECGYVE